ncbi:MAG: MFS transporter, partial [bacterium]|nr:MFS transporter [bacterium]
STEGSSRGSPLSTYKRLLWDPQFWRVFLVAILVNPCLYFNVNWLPTYFVQQWNLEEGAVLGGILTAIYLGLDAGYLIWGASILALVRRGLPVALARLLVFSVATVLMACSALVPLPAEMSWAVVALVAANCGTGMWIAMYLTMAQEVSATDVSTVAGLLGGSGSLSGAVAMWGVGTVTQVTSSFAVPFVGVATAALLAAIAGWRASRARHLNPPN